MQFEWDPGKARQNLEKHGVSFAEAMTAFADPLSLTVFDPEHSMEEDRYVLQGVSGLGRLVVVAHTDRGKPSASSVLDWPPGVSGGAMGTSKRRRAEDDMRAEYDFSGGVRGKYVARVGRGTNVVILDPDVARVFKTTEAVNTALRSQIGKRAGRKPARGPRRGSGR